MGKRGGRVWLSGAGQERLPGGEESSYSIKLSYNVNKALYKRGYTISGNCMEEKSHGGLCNPFLTFLYKYIMFIRFSSQINPTS